MRPLLANRGQFIHRDNRQCIESMSMVGYDIYLRIGGKRKQKPSAYSVVFVTFSQSKDQEGLIS